MPRIRVHYVPIATPDADSVSTDYEISRDDHDEITGRRRVVELWPLLERRYAREGMFVVKVDTL